MKTCKEIDNYESGLSSFGFTAVFTSSMKLQKGVSDQLLRKQSAWSFLGRLRLSCLQPGTEKHDQTLPFVIRRTGPEQLKLHAIAQFPGCLSKKFHVKDASLGLNVLFLVIERIKSIKPVATIYMSRGDRSPEAEMSLSQPSGIAYDLWGSGDSSALADIQLLVVQHPNKIQIDSRIQIDCLSLSLCLTKMRSRFRGWISTSKEDSSEDNTQSSNSRGVSLGTKSPSPANPCERRL